MPVESAWIAGVLVARINVMRDMMMQTLAVFPCAFGVINNFGQGLCPLPRRGISKKRMISKVLLFSKVLLISQRFSRGVADSSCHHGSEVRNILRILPPGCMRAK